MLSSHILIRHAPPLGLTNTLKRQFFRSFGSASSGSSGKNDDDTKSRNPLTSFGDAATRGAGQVVFLNSPQSGLAILGSLALGDPYLAGLAVGFWKSPKEISHQWQVEQRFEPTMKRSQRDRLYEGWKDAVARVRRSR